MKLIYLGHAAFLIETGTHRLLFDPFISPNPLAEGKVAVANLKPDVILLSHAHEDHIADAVTLAKQSGALVIANWEIIQWVLAQGIQNVHPMNHGGARRFPFGRVKMVNAIHSSSFPDGSYGGNPAGFVVTTSELSFYYSGDTALTSDMKLLAGDPPLRFAVFPVGDNFTMGADDAAKAATFVDTPEVIGVHHGTFPPIMIDRDAAKQVFLDAGKVLHLPEIGEEIEIA